MEEFVKGDIIVVSFPFSDLTDVKKRPALILTKLGGDDFILCQITSKTKLNDYSIILSNEDFLEGNLNLTSLIRTNKIFTADKSLVKYKVGTLKDKKLDEVIEKVCSILKS